MKAYHFLKADMTAGHGKEPPWTVGEERVWSGPLIFCKAGYHYGLTWYDALQNAPGPMACIVDVDPPERPDLTDGHKGDSRRRRLDAAYDASRELWLFACECTERILLRERGRGREPAPEAWRAIEVARRYAWGEATAEELDATRVATWAVTRTARYAAWYAVETAAWEAAKTAASDAARDASWDAGDAAWKAAKTAAWDARETTAARDASWKAAWATGDAERAWQRARLAEILDAVVVCPKEATW